MSEKAQSKRAKTSAMVVAARESCEILLSAVREHGPRVASIVEADIGAALPDPEPPGLEGTPIVLPMFDGLTTLLDHRLDRLISTDRTLFDAHALSASARHERDASTADLSSMIRSVRDAFRWGYPDLNIGLLGLEGRAAQETLPAIDQAERVAAKLRTADLSAERSLFEHQSLDPSLLAADFEKAAKRAQDAFVANRSATRRVETAMVGKETALGLYQTVFLRVARMFEDLCRLAGETKLAEKVRPSESRPGTLETLPPRDETPPDEEPASDEPATDEPALDETSA